MRSQNLHIALAYLTSRKRQSLVSVLGVAMGVGFFIGISAMMMGMQEFFIKQVVDVAPHVIIKDEYRNPPVQPVEAVYPDGAVNVQGTRPKEELRGIKNAERILKNLSQEFSQVDFAPILQGQVFLRFGGKDISATMVGIDPALHRKVSNLEKDLTHGTLNDLLTDSNGIILGEGLAQKLGAKMGNKLSVISPAGVILKMKVIGIFYTGIVNIDNFQAYALLKKNQVLQGKLNIVNQIQIKMKDPDNAIALAKTLENRYAYRTEPWQETNSNVFSIFKVQNAIMYSTVGAILVVAGFGIFNIISTIIYEKQRDIAILKSIGFSEWDIRAIFIWQGLMVGIIGTLAGWLLGYGIIYTLANIKITFEGFIRSQGFYLKHTVYQYIFSGVFACLCSMFSAYLPSNKAAKLRPVDIIRGIS